MALKPTANVQARDAKKIVFGFIFKLGEFGQKELFLSTYTARFRQKEARKFSSLGQNGDALIGCITLRTMLLLSQLVTYARHCTTILTSEEVIVLCAVLCTLVVIPCTAAAWQVFVRSIGKSIGVSGALTEIPLDQDRGSQS